MLSARSAKSIASMSQRGRRARGLAGGRDEGRGLGSGLTPLVASVKTHLSPLWMVRQSKGLRTAVVGAALNRLTGRS